MRKTEQNKLNKMSNYHSQYVQDTRENGITLVSLVITIIVLLVLAGVAINMAINSEGLFAKAGEATEEWNTAVGEEQNQVQDLLDQIGVEAPTEISQDIPVEWDSNKVAAVVKQGKRSAPVPKGFTASQVEGENTISGGLVIYQTETPVTGSNHTTALTEYNQFVWIPVDDINQMVMCKSNNKLADERDNKTCNLMLQENGTLKCLNSGHTSTATDLCGRLYGTDSTMSTTSGYKKAYTTNMDFFTRSQTWSSLAYREPDIVNSYDKDDTSSGQTYMATAGIVDGTVERFSSQLTIDFTSMATSVAKYRGFYVSRYEAGENGESKKEQLVLTDATSAGSKYLAGNMWYGLYNTLRNTTIVDKSIINTHMIWRKPVRPND